MVFDNKLIKEYLCSELNQTYSYGTAGFRLDGVDTVTVCTRACLMAWLFSMLYSTTMGAMVTASHNPASHNGVKIINADGNGLTPEQERMAEEIVNLSNDDFIKRCKKEANKGNSGKILLGRDTRDNGMEIVENTIAILNMFNTEYEGIAEYVDLNVTTTPELHYLTKAANKGKDQDYKDLILSMTHDINANKKEKVYLDTANGSALSFYDIETCEKLNMEVLDMPGKINEKKINENCGSEYALENYTKYQTFPVAAFDGDADRLVILTKVGENVVPLDGDDLAVMMIETVFSDFKKYDLNLGCVLSYYSNGASAEYVRNLGYDCELVGAGVKNFIEAAKNYDVCVWFEPNGHGGICFSDKTIETIKSDLTASQKVKDIIELFSCVHGDAIANLHIIRKYCTKLQSKINKKKCKLGKMCIADKNMIKITSKYVLTSPTVLAGHMEEINKRGNVRAFVRASGTENIVRIYVESDGMDTVEKVYEEIEQRIAETCCSDN